ncbi:MAG: helix-turn-helix domain-containing protein [Candidatus Thermoplasmatota archaeon]|nr:helix-turn-helix domain-containing protein [Candidatus Thermoplasmatota archaeon]
MRLPHLIIVEEVLPEVRRKMALYLHKDGMSQERIAGLLGTSQAMVSRYLRRRSELHADLEPIVGQVSMELSAAASMGEDPDQLTERFCRTLDRCISMGMLDSRYRSRFGRDPPAYFKVYRSESGRAAVLDELERAVEYLMSHPIPDLIPALKVNIAGGPAGARDLNDIASYPGRLPDRNGRLTQPSPPEYGASRHLASVLLSAMRYDPSITSAISLAFNVPVRSAMACGENDLVQLDRSSGSIHELLQREGPGKNRMVADPGDFGIEPCLYIFGASPLETAARAVELQNRIGDNNE